MKLQTQPNGHSCFVTSFAMCMDMTYDEVIRELGHDGNEVLDPNVPYPYCLRSIIDKELMDVAYAHGKMMSLYPSQLLWYKFNNDTQKFSTDARILPYPRGVGELVMRLKHRCILCYASKRGRPHASAWCPDTEQVYDPSGRILKIDDFLTSKNPEIYQIYIITSLSECGQQNSV